MSLWRFVYKTIIRNIIDIYNLIQYTNVKLTDEIAE